MQRLGDTGALKNHVKKQHFKGDNEKVAPSTLHKGAGGKPSTEEKTKSKRLFRELMAVVPEGYEDKEVPSIKKAKTSKAAAKNKTITISSDEDDSEEAQTQPPAISHSKKPKGKEPAMTTMTKETRQSKQSKQPKQTSKVPLNTEFRATGLKKSGTMLMMISWQGSIPTVFLIKSPGHTLESATSSATTMTVP
ncbi:hypothetical protein K432DRAFT_377435 [Lepidopterella palustris CBS 459.81]|uniref:Uncharacterized protein n=1 Tax=Lepidopterella palustris CBS 459.81 TaxID=1314670 RepID=A0A8E2EKD4_9PEZI|nr:hypothetical protein K432DRAFT_377435 [Lepidopterella palustris CBS 459.81]